MVINVVLHQLDRSGGCRVLLAAAEALGQAGHTVSVVFPRGMHLDTYPIDARVRIREVGFRIPRSGELSTLMRALSLAVFLPRAELILFSYYLCSWPVALRRLFRGTSHVVYFVQANEPLAFGTYAKRFRLVRRMLASLSLRLPFRYLSNSLYIADLLKQAYGQGSTIVPPGVDPAVFSPNGPVWEQSAPCVAVIGDRSTTKGWPMVTDTLRLLAERRTDFCVCAIGAETLEGLEFLGSRVRWITPREDTETAKALRSATVFFSSSRNEGFGLPVLESMAAGTPVVATDSAGVREILEDGRNGLLVPYGDAEGAARALSGLLDDTMRHAAFRNAGLATARHYSWKRFRQQLLVGLESVLSPRA